MNGATAALNDKLDAFLDREENRACNKAFKTKPEPRKTLRLAKLSKPKSGAYVRCKDSGKWRYEDE